MNKSIVIIACVASLMAACGASDADVSDLDPAYVSEVEAWRVERLAELKAEDGYINLAGLYWLQQETSRFGSAGDNDIVFPESAPAYMGEFTMTPDGVQMTLNDGLDARVNGDPVSSMLMLDDTSDSPVTVTMGSLAWLVVNREKQFAVRLRDFEHPALTSLPPIPSFDIDPEWRVEAKLLPFDEPKIMEVGTVIEGLGYNPVSPGIMAFEYDGVRYELEAYVTGDTLFFVFGDRTNGRDTYPAGRFLHSAHPDENGKTILDFNKSYNPPCAFGDFSTCPVASPKNRLPIRMEAGEKYIPALHVGTLTSH